jgi:diguanylate cyclase (GGDEF)-like protein
MSSAFPYSNLLVPVIVEEKVVALILVRKSKAAKTLFSNSDLQLVLAVGNQVAISIQRNQVEAELIHKSSHDALTDLPNRSLFLERLGQSITRSKRESGFEFAVLFFDIDDFKLVNDSLGHPVGDQFLIAIAERLKHNVRSTDLLSKSIMLSRFGGDEFAILLDGIESSEVALATANRLVGILSNPFKINEHQIYITASIGVAFGTFGYDQPDEILRDADMAMYQAKAMGKAQVQIFDKSMHNLAVERMRLRTALKQGHLQKDLHLHYQPIVSMKTGQISGFEALLRWYTPDKGVLNPADFFNIFDTSELIYSIDSWVLQKACERVIELSGKSSYDFPIYISVNLSAKNIKHPSLVQDIKAVLSETKLKPCQLWLEITEQASAPDDAGAIEVLKELRANGVRIYLDDFGTGYSALNYLARFPVDGLKIDSSFVNLIGQNEESEKVIEMIITLADHLGLVVVAEGVEKIEQEAFLKSLKCTYAQGYYYAKPMDALLASQYLANMNINAS